MDRSVRRVAALLFGSGACALVYQIAWLRELRLVFGASTAASAAVLAIFMGGLGVGSAWLGRRADAASNPLAMYAHLELGVAVSAALTPALVWVARAAYVALGGSVVLGGAGSTVVRLLLSVLVLAPPTILMGGTLPAAARAVESEGDARRRAVALLYGANAVGAVLGAFGSTFVLLEVFGVRVTLWMACLVNALVGVSARAMSRSMRVPAAALDASGASESAPAAAAPRGFVLAASFAVGFAFFLVELVWYRMLAPLLGGSSYTFGLILAVALLGIGLGGALYAAVGAGARATLYGFAITCGLEAMLVALPYALGDRLAVLALLLRPLGAVGFFGLVLGWAAVAAIVVLPAAIVAGFQFPLLIALLGRGRRSVGRDVGHAYAWNTAGAIAGSLAGGFGVLPLLSAPGAWRAVAAGLAGAGVAALMLGVVRDRAARGTDSWLPAGSIGRAVSAAMLIVGAVWLCGARGPTAAWRHSPIGAGRADGVIARATRNSLVDWVRAARREVAWEVDGVESGVAISTKNGTAFIVNGKSDGDARSDAPTQVMSGMLGALLHPHPRRALVVGLGTGSTAGWLGAVAEIERVDVVELEPAILEVARRCAPVNHDVLDNPKVHISIGDAREVLLTTPERYDVVFSEPSNPYRAGVSSLFTREFYGAAAARLAPGGIFMQWLQSYEVDAGALRSAYATLAAVFGSVDTWEMQSGDLVLVATMDPAPIDAALLRARIAEEPYRSALAVAWRVGDLEGVLSHFLAGHALARVFAREAGRSLNTDDRNGLEFALARQVGRGLVFDTKDLLSLSRAIPAHRPAVVGEVDWHSVEEQRVAMQAMFSTAIEAVAPVDEQQAARFAAYGRYAAGDVDGAIGAWSGQTAAPRTLFELELAAEGWARRGDEAAPAAIERLRVAQPVEADAFEAHLRFARGDVAGAAAALEAALRGYGLDPWPRMEPMARALQLAGRVGQADRALGRRLITVLREPFVLHMLDHERRKTVTNLSFGIDFQRLCAAAIEPLEPEVPWQGRLLARRVDCYRATRSDRLETAEREMIQFLRAAPEPLVGDALPAGEAGDDLDLGSRGPRSRSAPTPER